MTTLRIILTLLTLTSTAHARDEGGITPQPPKITLASTPA